MLRKLRERMESEKGFTLIELLVVILIIGILAAIALPAFLGQREKAQDGEAKSAARTAATAAKAYYTDNQSYTQPANVTVADLRAIEPSLNDGTAAGANFTVSNQAADSVRVGVVSKTGRTFWVTVNESTGVTTRTCSAAGGGCKTGGTW